MEREEKVRLKNERTKRIEHKIGIGILFFIAFILLLSFFMEIYSHGSGKWYLEDIIIPILFSSLGFFFLLIAISQFNYERKKSSSRLITKYTLQLAVGSSKPVDK
jgi:hypothetical protein